ncbi:glycine zipper family protein [Methylomonas sp. SURF-2]|uniref:Glycine zipper family protein n=1 Tax=Methylomonas subterranea TaxID=2952225 RepID=A0ABT1TH52_9GAMM|nr:glycine zipper family protein [Methylomonas sp. SURF-2]MCQ8104760.1 glycine zipper family protein [Methylomonas sp. SURF-2]
MNRGLKIVGCGMLLLISGCAQMPSGPSVMALPGSRMSFEQFQQDDYVCQQYAAARVGATPNQAAADSGVGSAVVGAALGAAAGAALGGGGGAAIGAGTGLVAGSMVGLGEGREAAYATQDGYDNAYVQCMYGKGHRVPVSGRFSDAYPVPAYGASTPIPPPPPGDPPPPPR